LKGMAEFEYHDNLPENERLTAKVAIVMARQIVEITGSILNKDDNIRIWF
jgi:hypothetical protein